MKRFIGSSAIVASAIFTAVAGLYLTEVWAGIQKHSPPCAPISGSTVWIFVAFTATGTLLPYDQFCLKVGMP